MAQDPEVIDDDLSDLGATPTVVADDLSDLGATPTPQDPSGQPTTDPGAIPEAFRQGMIDKSQQGFMPEMMQEGEQTWKTAKDLALLLPKTGLGTWQGVGGLAGTAFENPAQAVRNAAQTYQEIPATAGLDAINLARSVPEMIERGIKMSPAGLAYNLGKRWLQSEGVIAPPAKPTEQQIEEEYKNQKLSQELEAVRAKPVVPAQIGEADPGLKEAGVFALSSAWPSGKATIPKTYANWIRKNEVIAEARATGRTLVVPSQVDNLISAYSPSTGFLSTTLRKVEYRDIVNGANRLAPKLKEMEKNFKETVREAREQNPGLENIPGATDTAAGVAAMHIGENKKIMQIFNEALKTTGTEGRPIMIDPAPIGKLIIDEANKITSPHLKEYKTYLLREAELYIDPDTGVGRPLSLMDLDKERRFLNNQHHAYYNKDRLGQYRMIVADPELQVGLKAAAKLRDILFSTLDSVAPQLEQAGYRHAREMMLDVQANMNLAQAAEKQAQRQIQLNGNIPLEQKAAAFIAGSMLPEILFGGLSASEAGLKLAKIGFAAGIAEIFKKVKSPDYKFRKAYAGLRPIVGDTSWKKPFSKPEPPPGTIAHQNWVVEKLKHFKKVMLAKFGGETIPTEVESQHGLSEQIASTPIEAQAAEVGMTPATLEKKAAQEGVDHPAIKDPEILKQIAVDEKVKKRKARRKPGS